MARIHRVHPVACDRYNTFLFNKSSKLHRRPIELLNRILCGTMTATHSAYERLIANLNLKNSSVLASCMHDVEMVVRENTTELDQDATRFIMRLAIFFWTLDIFKIKHPGPSFSSPQLKTISARIRREKYDQTMLIIKEKCEGSVSNAVREKAFAMIRGRGLVRDSVLRNSRSIIPQFLPTALESVPMDCVPQPIQATILPEQDVDTPTKSRRSITTRINNPPCSNCQDRGDFCTSSGSSARCDLCKFIKKGCSLLKRKLPDDGPSMSIPSANKRRVGPSPVQSEKPETNSEGLDGQHPSSISLNATPIGNENHSLPVTPPSYPTVPEIQQIESAAIPSHETKIQADGDLQDLSSSREAFFQVLTKYKAELGGQNSKTFKELYLSAKMWAAQEDLCLGL
ncbi:hypothetical protein ABKN59_008569 [Abortiporus biennis]